MTSPDPNAKRAARRAPLPVWWLLSLVFHALLFGWLLFFSPIRIINSASERSHPASKISPARAAQIMEQVREQQAGALSEEVQKLEAIRRELAELETGKREELRRTLTNAPADALDKVTALQQQAAQAQTNASEAMAAAEKQLQTAAAVGGQTNAAAMPEAGEAAKAALETAGQLQAQALETLAVADPRFEAAYQAQAEASAAQSRAALAQAEAMGRLSAAAAIRSGADPKQKELAAATEALRNTESQLAAAYTNVAAVSNRLQQLRAEVAGEVVTTGKKKMSSAQMAAGNLQKNLTRAESQLPRLQQRVNEQTARVAKFTTPGASAAERGVEMERSAAEKQTEARQLQATARSAQASAATAFANAQSGQATSAPSEAAPAPSAPKDLAGVYQAAMQTESELAETYRRLRATDLAMARQIPLARALELTEVARPARPDLASQLRGAAANGADLETQRQVVQDVRSEIGTMRSLADSMLAQARGLSQTGVSQQQNLAQLAAEDEGQRAKDLTGAMRSGTGTGASGAAGLASGTAGARSGSTGGRPASGGGGAGSASGPDAGRDPGSSAPPPISKNLAALPGRVVGANAVPGRWMFVDSWYVLGPFDNTGRANLEKQFPPETVVDLNAEYLGKLGMPVRWEFYQSSEPRIVAPFDNFFPPGAGGAGGSQAVKFRELEYIIYYGYTELRAVEACDVWLGVGSDDFSKVWLNDQLVWASGKEQKDWRVDEGFRKVRLQKGVNRILYRVENGHSRTDFSLVLCAADDRQGAAPGSNP